MGGFSSVQSCHSLIYNNEPNLVQWKTLFDGMFILEDDVGRYYSLFQTLDTEQLGFVDTLHLFKFLEIEGNAFMERVFSLQSTNQSTLIDFKAFVLVLWNFCSLDHTKINIIGEHNSMYLSSLIVM